MLDVLGILEPDGYPDEVFSDAGGLSLGLGEKGVTEVHGHRDGCVQAAQAHSKVDQLERRHEGSRMNGFARLRWEILIIVG